MSIKIGKHELFIKHGPEVSIDEKMRIISIIITVEDKEGKRYELHYLSSMDDPDLVVTGSFFEDLAEL